MFIITLMVATSYRPVVMQTCSRLITTALLAKVRLFVSQSSDLAIPLPQFANGFEDLAGRRFDLITSHYCSLAWAILSVEDHRGRWDDQVNQVILICEERSIDTSIWIQAKSLADDCCKCMTTPDCMTEYGKL